MYMTTGEILSTLTMWMIIILIASFHFGMVGLNAAHHHPDIYHDGDAARYSMFYFQQTNLFHCI